MGPASFLTKLWGPAPTGFILIWELAGKRSRYFRAPAGTRGLAGHTDVYTGVGLAHKDHGKLKRAGNDQIIALAGLWLDLDVDGGPNNKTGAIPTKTNAAVIAHEHRDPTLLIDSGYGLHAWHLFDEPWRFATRDEQQAAALASAQWYALHRSACRLSGWDLDHTHDLARVLRLPGTINGKGGRQAEVRALQDDGPRYPRAELLELAAQAGDIPISGPAQLRLDGAGDPIEIATGTIGETTRVKIEALAANIPEFAATWRHQLGARAAAWTMSEYDLSLCSQAAQAGFDNQELADLIRLHRAEHGDAKGERRDYLQRTIAMVRAPSERASAIEQLHARHTESLRRAA